VIPDVGCSIRLHSDKSITKIALNGYTSKCTKRSGSAQTLQLDVKGKEGGHDLDSFNLSITNFTTEY